MKGYIDYMDNVTVSEQLHTKIMTGLKHKPVRRSLPFRRYAAACACAAIAFVVLWVSVLSGPSGYVSDEALVFNQAKHSPALATKRHIPGYFQEELSQETTQNLLGDAWDFLRDSGYTITATAGFTGDGTLDGITVLSTSKGNQQIRVMIAGNALTVDRQLFARDPLISKGFGPSIMAGHWVDPSDANKGIYFAAFQLNGTDFYIETTSHKDADEEVTKLVNKLLATANTDLSGIAPSHIPEWREDELTIAQAQADPNFGAYVPVKTLPGLAFESAMRIVGQSQDELRVSYHSGMKYASLVISRLSAEDASRVVDPSKPETYDLRLYPIPRASTVPAELSEIVGNPIFKLEDLTLALVEARAYTLNEAGDDNTGYRMSFSVLYGDVVVRLDVKGAQPGDVLEMLKSLGQ